jgi:predicted tellurium resistance membrane protein TerC
MKDAAKGKRYLYVIIGAILGFSLLSLFGTLADARKVVIWVIRFSLVVILSYLIFQGNRKAKIFLGLMTLLTAGQFLTLVSFLTGLPAFVSTVLGIGFIFMGVMLFASKEITKFMDQQRTHLEREVSNSKLSPKKESHWDKQLKR